jgi:hypothetical protein
VFGLSEVVAIPFHVAYGALDAGMEGVVPFPAAPVVSDLGKESVAPSADVPSETSHDYGDAPIMAVGAAAQPSVPEGPGIAGITPGNAEPVADGRIPLPGIEGESLEILMLPLLPGIIHAVRDALADTQRGNDSHNALAVQQAAGRLAEKAEMFGLHKLGKIGRCVERAAAADDVEAVGVLMEDVLIVTHRYLNSMQDCYNAFMYQDRRA